MKLRLYHGREDVNEQMNDWGVTGPIIKGVKYLSVVYITSFIVGFETVEDFVTAKEQTGWETWDDDSLRMKINGDCVTVKDMHYGDWSLEM